MKVRILVIALILILCSISMNVQADKTIRVYGSVTLDGEPIENLEIKIKNIDRGFEISTYTDSNGNYEGYTTTRDHENIRVEAKYNQTTNYQEFEVISNENEYEVNFEFENDNNGNNNNGNGVIIDGIVFLEWVWDQIIGITLINLIKCLIIIFLILLILRIIFPKRNRVTTQPGMDNDTIILLPNSMNAKVRKI